MIITELSVILDEFGVPVRKKFFKAGESRPAKYIVIIPIAEMFTIHADDMPIREKQEARLFISSKDDTTDLRREIALALLNAGFSVSDRRFSEYDSVTGYCVYTIDVANDYVFEAKKLDGEY